MPRANNILIYAAAFCGLTAAYVTPAQAAGKWFEEWERDRDGGRPDGGGNSGGPNKGAPGPIAGAGLPFLLLAGGYVLVRRYRSRNKAE